MTRQNVGRVDAYMRIAVGVVICLSSTARPQARRGVWLRWLGAMLIASGITRFSPLLALLRTSTLESVASTVGRGEPDAYKGRKPLPTPPLPLSAPDVVEKKEGRAFRDAPWTRNLDY